MRGNHAAQGQCGSHGRNERIAEGGAAAAARGGRGREEERRVRAAQQACSAIPQAIRRCPLLFSLRQTFLRLEKSANRSYAWPTPVTRFASRQITFMFSRALADNSREIHAFDGRLFHPKSLKNRRQGEKIARKLPKNMPTIVAKTFGQKKWPTKIGQTHLPNKQQKMPKKCQNLWPKHFAKQNWPKNGQTHWPTKWPNKKWPKNGQTNLGKK